jgi:serine/threonine-protein kinase
MSDPEIDALVRAERTLEAAALAESRGQVRLAVDLYERACEFGRAAAVALRTGDAARSLMLAVVGRDAGAEALALEALARDPDRARRTAETLARRGDHAPAARLWEAANEPVLAAQAWERAGDAIRAARLYERGSDPVAAAKALEGALRRAPADDAVQLALGELLLRYGKVEAATRALQKVPSGAPARRAALTALVRAFGQLGLSSAEAEARRELDALGGPAPEAADEGPRGSPKQRIYGRYEVVREVASTASARVLECVDPVRGERVAVKVFAGWDARGMGRDVLLRFEREVRALDAIDHPNVVPLRDFVPDGPAIVLAWMSGGTLESMMQAPIAPGRAVEIARAVLAALGEAHRLGILHRDVKPSNVLFDDAGVARLGDFGVAHLGDASATATAGVIGTLAYMSPEQREGRPATVQSDVYGVGAMLFEILTGERISGLEAPRTRPSGVHRDLDARHDDVVLRMVAEDPAARPADAFTARKELAALTWPKTIEPAAKAARTTRSPSEHPEAMRLEPRAAGRAFDRVAEREVTLVPATEANVARAGAFARAAHPLLQTVLRVDREEKSIWLEDAGDVRVGVLSPEEVAELGRALAALHAEGHAHGSVDETHLRRSAAGEIVLLFPAEADPLATADTDQAAWRRLGANVL